MRNILGISGGVVLVVLVAATQIRTAQPTPGGFIPGNAFAQEPGRSASDDRSQGVDTPLQQPQDSAFAVVDAAPRPEPRPDRRFTPQRWATTPTM